MKQTNGLPSLSSHLPELPRVDREPPNSQRSVASGSENSDEIPLLHVQIRRRTSETWSEEISSRDQTMNDVRMGRDGWEEGWVGRQGVDGWDEEESSGRSGFAEREP